MKCTLYILRCLRTGNHSMGVTTDLRGRLKSLLAGESPTRIVHPEIMHIEQLEDLVSGHRRLQQIRSRWRDPDYPQAPEFADRNAFGGN